MFNTEYIFDIFRDLAKQCAEKMVDELLVKKGGIPSKEQFVQQKEQMFLEELTAGYRGVVQKIEAVFPILQERLFALPASVQQQYKDELNRASALLQEGIWEKLEEFSSVQKMLGLSNALLLWVYEIGHQFYQSKDYQHAEPCFILLVLLNSRVRDYWMALGIAYRAVQNHPMSLYAFSVASFLDPNHVMSRYQSAITYLYLAQFDDALAELSDVSQLAQEQKITHLQPKIQQLMQRAKNRKSLMIE